VSFAAITLCFASQRVFIVVSLYIVNHSVRKLLDTPRIIQNCAVCVRVTKLTFINVHGVAMKFPKLFYCDHTSTLTVLIEVTPLEQLCT
jgi:hypothetical protein